MNEEVKAALANSNWAEACVQLILSDSSVSIVELRRLVEDRFDCQGDHAVFSSDEHNIAIWFGASETFAKVLIEITHDKRIEMKPTSVLVYMIDGQSFGAPLAKSLRHYKKPRWLPVVFNPA